MHPRKVFKSSVNKSVKAATAVSPTAKGSRLKECAKFVQQFFKKTKTPFVVEFEDIYDSESGSITEPVKLNSRVNRSKNGYFVSVEYNTWIGDEGGEDAFIEVTIEEAIEAAYARYPEFDFRRDYSWSREMPGRGPGVKRDGISITVEENNA